MQYREGLEYLVAWYPTGLLALFAYRGHNLGPNRAILPREIRERIEVLPVGYEFYLSDSRTLLRTGMYTCKVYDNTILTVEKVPLQATLADEPIIRAAFDIYLEDGLLVYVAEPCVTGGDSVCPPVSGRGGGLACAPGGIWVRQPGLSGEPARGGREAVCTSGAVAGVRDRAAGDRGVQ